MGHSFWKKVGNCAGTMLLVDSLYGEIRESAGVAGLAENLQPQGTRRCIWGNLSCFVCEGSCPFVFRDFEGFWRYRCGGRYFGDANSHAELSIFK